MCDNSLLIVSVTRWTESLGRIRKKWTDHGTSENVVQNCISNEGEGHEEEGREGSGPFVGGSHAGQSSPVSFNTNQVFCCLVCIVKTFSTALYLVC